MQTIAVIPAFNEATTIAEVVTRVREILPDVVVIDDGSTDDTSARARGAGAVVLRHCVNRGLGAAIGTGLAAAWQRGADAIVTLDADGQHDPAEIPALLLPIASGTADLVIGVRGGDGAPLHRRLFHATGNIFTRALFGVRCSDTQSGFRVFHRRAVERIDIRTNRMEVSSEILAEAHRHHLRIVEVPIRTIYTTYSLAKGQSFTVGVKTAWALLLRRLF
ncbi:glycosyltransferase family 2 protein [Candidatus Uhrbacteria bacterium]|nr:glycosyltransferase family 2 protein [Candidatus Uhrbacteria bacterium]